MDEKSSLSLTLKDELREMTFGNEVLWRIFEEREKVRG
jgi:hypothetical protein